MYRTATERFSTLLAESDATVAALKKQVEQLRCDLQAMEDVPVAEDLTMELFFSFAM